LTKYVSFDDLSRAFDGELIWRRKEISDLSQAIRDCPSVSRPSLLRAFIPLLYAHWEGFSIRSASMYFDYITQRRLNIGSLSTHFGNFVFSRRLGALIAQGSSMDEKLSFLSHLRTESSLRFSKTPADLIDSGSNLNISRMRVLCRVCDVDSVFLDGFEDLIDVELLKRRNEIAHGEWVSVVEDDVPRLSDAVFSLLSTFRNLLENSIVEEKFKKSA
jgi:hypothetical protein